LFFTKAIKVGAMSPLQRIGIQRPPERRRGLQVRAFFRGTAKPLLENTEQEAAPPMWRVLVSVTSKDKKLAVFGRSDSVALTQNYIRFCQNHGFLHSSGINHSFPPSIRYYLINKSL